MVVGEMVRVREDIDETTCPVSACTAGEIGMVEDLQTDEDGETAALIWFGKRIARLYNDGCWIYLENLEPAPKATRR
jgi:hypothetical protein